MSPSGVMPKPEISPRALIAVSHNRNRGESGARSFRFFGGLLLCQIAGLGTPSGSNDWPTATPSSLIDTAALPASPGRGRSFRIPVCLLQRKASGGLSGSISAPAMARLQLGRAFVLSGDLAKSKTAYQDFLTLWRDADPAIPILRQAKAEYARLR
jgi:hypothetical protein